MKTKSPTLTIKESTIKIPAHACQNSAYTEITFPSTLQEIGPNAFSGSSSIRNLRLPEGLKKIGSEAFRNCTGLQDIYIPESVEEIGESAFTHFRLIYCARLERTEGWFFKKEPHICRTWYGSYPCTAAGSLSEPAMLEDDPGRRIVWYRSWENFRISRGVWYFDIFHYLESLGEETLRRGMVPGMNLQMRAILLEIKEKMENRSSPNDSIIVLLDKYQNGLLEPFATEGHIGEWLFCMWSVYHYIWQLAQLEGNVERRACWIAPAMEEKAKYSAMLKKAGGKRWERIEMLLRNVNLKNAGLASMIKQYYKYSDKGFEAKIFNAYDERFFGRKWEADTFKTQMGETCFHQAVELIKQKKYDEAGKLFEKSARNGNADGQYNYGLVLMNGEGCKPDPLQGSFWYWKAAKAGNDKAMVNLGINYRRGAGVLQDGLKMLYWYAKAANALNPNAVYNLGLSLKNEEVVSGSCSTGLTLIQASDELADDAVAAYVKKTTELILIALAKEIDCPEVIE